MAKGQILVVDDKEMMRDSVAATLTRMGHTVVSAADGAAALQKLAERGVDAIITDLQMPEMGGMDLLAEIRRIDESVPVIIMTAYGTVETGGGGVLRRHDQQGSPLDVRSKDTKDPTVIDLNGLSAVPSLQRFVVATVLNQLVEERTGSAAQRGLIYLVTLDELNRFAPRGSHDPITELIERVAAEMRSQGIILLGAQQQASLVSPRVIENAGIRVLGKSGSLELGDQVWRFLSEAARKKALDELKRLFGAYTERKLANQALDYDDLLLYWHAMMEDDALAREIADQFDHVLVDVTSSTSAEYEVLHLNSGRAAQVSDHDPPVLRLQISSR